MSDIVAICSYCKNGIADTDAGVTWVGNYIYCSDWCAENDTNEKLKSSPRINLESNKSIKIDVED